MPHYRATLSFILQSTGVGIVVDMGRCTNNASNPTTQCCGYCNNESLAEAGIDATGAAMVMNMWGNGVGQQLVGSHTPGTSKIFYNATWCKDEIAKRGKCADGFRNGNGR